MGDGRIKFEFVRLLEVEERGVIYADSEEDAKDRLADSDEPADEIYRGVLDVLELVEVRSSEERV